MNETTRPNAVRLRRSTRNSLTTTTAIHEAPATHTARRTMRTPATIPESPITAHRIDSDVCSAVESHSGSGSHGTSSQ